MELTAARMMKEHTAKPKTRRRIETPLFSSTWVALFLVLRRQWEQSRSG